MVTCHASFIFLQLCDVTKEMPPIKRRNKLPAPFPEGLILTDTSKNNWRLGKVIGEGGFGLIYLASPDCDQPVTDDAKHVIKVEYHENGPLFCELKFYQRAASDKQINSWIASHRLDYIGIPKYWGSGQTQSNSTCYRFMVIDRLGMDLQKLLLNNGGTFSLQTIMQLGIRLLDILEYIHEQEYVHGDIKAANVLLHYKDPNKVYLADYGLSYRYCPNGNHKPYKENPRKGHNGTIEFTSLDAHKGVAVSRRGDLQILAFCMLYWLCGKLPWEQKLKDPTAVHDSKTKFLAELPGSIIEWSGQKNSCEALSRFMTDVRCLEYTEKPNYGALRKILLNGLQSTGTSLGAPLTFLQLKPILKKPAAFNTPQNNKRQMRLRLVSPGENSKLQDLTNANQQSSREQKSPKNSTRRNAKEVSVEEDKDANYMRNGDWENPCGLHRRNQGDLCPQLVSITKPQGTVNVRLVQTYNITKDKGSAHVENHVHQKHILESQIENNPHRDRKDIYKYSLLIIIFLLMILIVIK